MNQGQQLRPKNACRPEAIGTVDVFFVSHHGQPVSNAEVLVHAIQSRVAIMNNGTRKGGQPPAMRIIHSAPGLEDLWQVHFSQLSGQEHTAPGMFIANTVDEQPDAMPVAAMTPPQPGPGAAPAPVHNGASYWIKVSAQPDGAFTVTNARNGFSKTYRPRVADRLHLFVAARAVDRRHRYAQHAQIDGNWPRW